MGSSADEIAADIRAQFKQQVRAGEYDAPLDEFMADDVVPVWKENSPVDSGDYVDSVGVIERASAGKGKVGATDEAANIVEYGSIHNKAYAPRARTEAHFNSATGINDLDVL